MLLLGLLTCTVLTARHEVGPQGCGREGIHSLDRIGGSTFVMSTSVVPNARH